MAIRVLDDYYLAITALVTIAYQLLFFFIAYTLQFDKVTDIAGGTNFILLALLSLGLSQSPTSRQLVASLFLAVWALRVGLFLLYRVIRTGGDHRFDEMRSKFLSFLGFWIFQMFWVWTVSLPVVLLNSPAVRDAFASSRENGISVKEFGTAEDIVGVVMWAVGFFLEAGADAQRFTWRQKRVDESEICDGGFFKYSRHPNYFGDILLQFGIYTIAVSPASNGYLGNGGAHAALYASIVGPIFLTVLLMFVSGLPLSERPTAKKRYEKGLDWPAYQKYLNRTSILVPFPPQIYERLPRVVKRTLFLELPMYVFDPETHSDAQT